MSTASRGLVLPWAVALALPFLVAASSVPDAVFYNQLLAVAAWGCWVAAAPSAGGGAPRGAALAAALAAFGVCAAAAALGGLGLRGAALPVMVAAAVVMLAAHGAASARAVLPVAAALWLAGLASCAVAVLQYAAPGWGEGWWLAASGTAGRAVGNLRQPNHLATALLCAMVMTVWLWQIGWLKAGAAVASLGAMVLALAMSASRTGALALAVLALWAVLDGRLPRTARRALLVLPLLYLACWGGLAAHAALDDAQFYGADRLQSGSDISSSRFAIWRNALVLLSQQPWTGVGWGQFNLAWTFASFPDRPVAFFDHTHNLPLQLAVEMGLPAAIAVLALLGWAVWRARGAWVAEVESHPGRAMLAMLAVLALHSLLEYPLWYAYFLLPAAWALGVFIGQDGPLAQGGPTHARWPLRTAGALMLAACAWAAVDHRTVEQIFAPSPGAAPLAERIATGRRSLWFGHHADYAAVTTPPRVIDPDAFARPLRQLVDVRLLIAYAEALKANGRVAEALYAAQRLREFRRPDAQAYFAACAGAAEAQPWQCETRPVALTWRDVLP